ncbi:hypothetical protein F4778DRAFT_308352 [Xylariomycetidae sp. FL2044]|nr:hypothetical protein F4778DRAFT_308352 [Xylariomycetidae sp. FL2044]
MTSNVNITRRQPLEPLWTGSAPGQIVIRAATGDMMSPSPMSPNFLPSPRYPMTYNNPLWKHDRELVKSFNTRTGHSSPATPTYSALTEDQSPLVSKLEEMAESPRRGIPTGLPSPPSPYISTPRVYSHSQAVPSPRGPHSPAYHQAYRSTTTTNYRLSTSTASPSTPISSGRLNQEQLRAWGRVCFDDVKTADAFIVARSLRRRGESLPHSPEQAALSRQNTPNNRSTFRVIVQPRGQGRRPFLMQRNLDVEALRSGVKSPSRQSGPDAARGAPPPPPRRCSGSVRSSALLRQHDDSRTSFEYEGLIRDANAVPIHTRYARAHLPVLAHILLSGHVRKGDIVYLPLPHAEVWRETLRYVYTGDEAGPSPAVRENILYLAGKV